jgi:tRNA threonylcarbamoyl adenosine modification protein YeaZ/ribosomal-protein-alanine acetyltransferase
VAAGELDDDEDAVTGGKIVARVRNRFAPKEPTLWRSITLPLMVVLALETATRQGSVALWLDGLTTAREGDAQRTHGERLPTELLDWLARHDRTIRDVDLFAVVSGPGSFTGLRVGMAAIQGLALATNRRVVPVPTLEAMAGVWLEAHPDERRAIVTCLDGQRGDVFVAAYAAEPGGSPPYRVLREPSVGPAESKTEWIASLGSASGLLLLGNGARRYAPAFESRIPGIEIADVPGPLARWAAMQAAVRPEAAVSPHALRPIYVRRPDAELARERAQGRTADRPGAGFVIRRVATPGDLSAVDRLQRQTFTNPWGVDALRWELEHTDVARIYVAEAPDGEVVAYCACWMVFDELHINSLAVDEGWRQRGIARRLMEEVHADAIRSGARTATLEVRESNAAARALYEGLGFRVEAARRDYYQHPRENALVLWHRRLAE